MESASFALPTVNVGSRQQGRERARNVLDADAHRGAILEAVKTARTAEFRQSLVGMVNPYGEGFASENIVRVLTSSPSLAGPSDETPSRYSCVCCGPRPFATFMRIPLSAPDVTERDIDAVTEVLRTSSLELRT